MDDAVVPDSASSLSTPGRAGADSPIVSLSFDRVPAPKGAAVHIEAFARALGRAFGGVELVTLANRPGEDLRRLGPGIDAPVELGDGVRHHPIRVLGRNPVERCLSLRRSLARWWRDRRCEVIHVRSIFEGYPLALRRDRLCRAFVYEVNGLPSIELKYHYPRVADDVDLLTKLQRQEQLCLDRADLIVTPSGVTADYLSSERGVPSDRIRVIPNGVEREVFRFRRARSWPEALADPEGPRWLYTGTMTAWQGVHVALEALALFRRDAPARLTLLGPLRSRRRRELERLAEKLAIRDAVTFAEPRPPAGVAAALAEHDLALAPLLSNDRNRVQGCSPLKVLEAMAVGAPLIASDLPCVSDLATHGEDAWLVRPGSAKGVKDGVLELVRDPALPGRLAANARARLERLGGWERAGRDLVNAYRRLPVKLESP